MPAVPPRRIARVPAAAFTGADPRLFGSTTTGEPFYAWAWPTDAHVRARTSPNQRSRRRDDAAQEAKPT
jgi:hypothetical protein